ncbi:MAG: hypothetical protein JWO13_230 [Acidobacteriales bacterium]|nr:hypothetical protein [Terriglobales bacterium]
MQTKLFLIALALTCATAVAQSKPADKKSDMADCPTHAEHTARSADHYSGVDSRGDKAMGFSHTATTHHFRVLEKGGAIEAVVNDPNDSANLTAIRGHMQHIAKMFAAGNFDTPMFIHGRVPPGVPTMKKLGSQIDYSYEETEKGARIRITTANATALKSIHEFLRFQISDHRTADKP